MYLETAQTNTTAKLPILKQENGNSFKPAAQTTTNADCTSTTLITGPVTTEEKTQKKNNVKARSMLLMELPNEHLLTFNQYKDAKTLFAAIQTRFGWLQKINKPDLDTMSFDDLYNNFKIVEQEVKETASSSSSSQNMAFFHLLASTNEVNTAYGVSTANTQVCLLVNQVITASTQDNTANLSDATVYAFLASQPNGSQLIHEDLEQIHKDDLEEIDLKWQLTLLSMRTRRFFQKTGKNITINGSDTAGFDKSSGGFNYSQDGHFAIGMQGPRNQDSRKRNQDSSRRSINVEETSSKAILAIDRVGFDWSYMEDDEVPTNMAIIAFSDSTKLFNLATYKRGLAYVEEQLVFYKKNEVIFCEQLAVLKRDISYKDSEISMLKSELEKLKQEKESNQLKIEKFDNASKSLDKLIGSQIPDKSRKGVGLITLHSKEETRYLAENNYTRVNYNYSAKKAHPSAHRNMAPRVVLMKTGLRPLNTTRPKAVNTARPNSAVVNAVRANQVNAVKGSSWSSKRRSRLCDTWMFKHMDREPVYISDLKEFDGGLLPLGERAKGGKLCYNSSAKWVLLERRYWDTIEAVDPFDEKFMNEGFFVGYSLNSKAFRVYNIRTRKVEENLHIRFLEDKPIIEGDGPKWLFDIDVLTKSMNYVPVVAGTNCNDFAGTKESIDACHSNKETGSSQDYILMPLYKDGSLFDSSSKNASNDKPQPSSDAGKNDDEGSLLPCHEICDDVQSVYHDRKNEQMIKEEAQAVDLPYGKSAIGTKMSDKTRKIMRRIEAIRLFLAYASFKDFVMYQIDVKSVFLYGKTKEEVYVCQPPGFEDPRYPISQVAISWEEIDLMEIDSNEKKLIQMIKIHTDQNVTDLLTKAFDVSRFQYLIASIGMLNLWNID
ncbi:ribonuclease H-like domain-containing protein [Tanacetum coccineum]